MTKDKSHHKHNEQSELNKTVLAFEYDKSWNEARKHIQTRTQR